MIEIDLPATFDVAAAHMLKAQVVAAGLAGTIVLKADQVSEAGTALIQVIEVCRRAVEAAGGRLVLHGPSDAVIAAYDDLGLGADVSRYSHAG